MASSWQFSLLVSLFVLWGACSALNDVLIQQFKLAFTLTDAESSLVQTAFYGGYLVGAPPAAACARRYGYKRCVVVGLGLNCAGAALFWPTSHSSQPQYAALLGCLYLLALGLAFLECAANPWVLLLGERRRPGSGTRALNLAQSFNPLGSICGVLLGRELILDSHSAGAGLDSGPRGTPLGEMPAAVPGGVAAVGAAYLILGSLFACAAVAFVFTRFAAGDGRTESTGGSARVGWGRRRCASLGRPGFVLGVVAQFLYTGGQTSLWSFAIRYTRQALPAISDKRASDTLLASLFLFVIGRFGSTALLRRVAAARLMAIQCGLAALCCAVAGSSYSPLGVGALCFASLFMGMIFPTIFGLSLATLDSSDHEIGASLLVMAIIGGAVITPIMGLVSDLAGSIRLALSVPALCFVGIGGFAAEHARGRFGVRPSAGGTSRAAELGSSAPEWVGSNTPL